MGRRECKGIRPWPRAGSTTGRSRRGICRSIHIITYIRTHIDTVLVHALRNGLSMTSHLIWKKNITDFNVQSLCFDHTGRRLACSSLNGTRIDVWKTSSEGRNIKTLESTQVLCDAPVVWASHWALLAATIDSSIVMWTISEWEPRTIEFPKWLRNSRVEITALSCPSATTTSDHIAVAGFSDGRACIFKIIKFLFTFEIVL